MERYLQSMSTETDRPDNFGYTTVESLRRKGGQLTVQNYRSLEDFCENCQKWGFELRYSFLPSDSMWEFANPKACLLYSGTRVAAWWGKFPDIKEIFNVIMYELIGDKND